MTPLLWVSGLYLSHHGLTELVQLGGLFGWLFSQHVIHFENLQTYRTKPKGQSLLPALATLCQQARPSSPPGHLAALLFYLLLQSLEQTGEGNSPPLFIHSRLEIFKGSPDSHISEPSPRSRAAPYLCRGRMKSPLKPAKAAKSPHACCHQPSSADHCCCQGSCQCPQRPSPPVPPAGRSPRTRHTTFGSPWQTPPYLHGLYSCSHPGTDLWQKRVISPSRTPKEQRNWLT